MKARLLWGAGGLLALVLVVLGAVGVYLMRAQPQHEGTLRLAGLKSPVKISRDGAGVVQSMEIIRLFRDVGIRPKNTIRIVAFMNEENGLKGGRKYAELAKNKNEKHLCAIETDAGAFSPRGLSMDGNDTLRSLIRSWKPLLEPYGLYDFEREGGGADISPLKDQQVPVFELMPDSQRYFNYHHTNKDVFEAIDRRELELCAAAMASLVYLLDQYDWK